MPPPPPPLQFEFSHVLIFFVALILVADGCIVAKRLRQCKREWFISQSMKSEDIKARYEADKASPYFYWSRTREIMEFQIVEAQFFRAFSLPSDFDMAIFLAHNANVMFEELLDVSVFDWSSIILLCGLIIGIGEGAKAANGGEAHAAKSVRVLFLLYSAPLCVRRSPCSCLFALLS